VSHPGRTFSIVGVLVVLAAAVVGGLAFANRRGETGIDQVMTAPDQFAGQVIRLRGEVGEVIPIELLGFSGFRLGRGQDAIWVVASNAPPARNTTVVVRGTVRAAGFGDLIRVGPMIWDATVEPAPWP